MAEKKQDLHIDLGLDGIFEGITEVVEKVGRFAESVGSEEGKARVDEIKRRLGEEEETKFKVSPKVHETAKKPRGNVRTLELDVMEEADHILVVGDMPGVEKDDITFEIGEQLLTLSAENPERKYKKQLELPAPVKVEEAALSYKNGVLELKLPKA